MKSKSVDILDDATDFETKLSWILFKQEIAHIWDGGEGEWRPGDLMYPKPSPYGWMIPDDMPVEFYQAGNTQAVRPMIAELDPSVRYGQVQEQSLFWCRDCQVGWRTEEPCWSCGRPLTPEELKLLFDYHVTVYKHPEFRRSSDFGAGYMEEVMRQMWAHLNTPLPSQEELCLSRHLFFAI